MSNNRQAIKEEEGHYQELPVIRDVTEEMVMVNFLQTRRILTTELRAEQSAAD